MQEVFAFGIARVEIVVIAGVDIDSALPERLDRFFAHELRARVDFQSVFSPQARLVRDDPKGRMGVRAVDHAQFSLVAHEGILPVILDDASFSPSRLRMSNGQEHTSELQSRVDISYA